jgi:hypothetical protein
MQFGSTFNNSAWRHELAAVCELRSRGGSLTASLLAHERQACCSLVALAIVMSAGGLEALAAKLKAARDAEKRRARLADGHLAIAR